MLHPDAALLLICNGLLYQEAGMESHVNRDVRYHSWTPSMGTQARDFTFKIIGVQRDWQGRTCWRALCNDGHDQFGRVVHPDEVEFVSPVEI